mgnify:CR=1 FL=1|jgi:alanine racemase
MLENYARAYILTDVDAAVYNMQQMHSVLKPGTMMTAVLKADGYGHGAIPIARALEPLPYVWGYAAATPEEAFQMRECGLKKNILILGTAMPYSYRRLAAENITPAVYTDEMIDEMAAAAEAENKIMTVHIKVDTGMSRIGLTPDDRGLSIVKKALETKQLRVEGIFTHFAKADEADKTDVNGRIAVFNAFTQRIEKELGARIPVIHCSNSAGILDLPQANMDMVRAGITLYGMWPSDEVDKKVIDLRPVMSFYSSISYIKEVPAGTQISYGGTFTAAHAMRVATIPVGYADGYPRSLSNKGSVLIHGRRAAILGRVCMDQFMADVTDIPEAKLLDKVTLIGSDGNETITMEELGDMSGRFNYELACDLSKRVPRAFRCGGRITATQDYFGDSAIKWLT